MRKRATLLLVAILAFQCILQARADSTWSIQTVDENGNRTGVSLALDSKDNPHLCYTAYVNGYYRNPRYLMYAKLERFRLEHATRRCDN
jgi:hypothetical protein